MRANERPKLQNEPFCPRFVLLFMVVVEARRRVGGGRRQEISLARTPHKSRTTSAARSLELTCAEPVAVCSESTSTPNSPANGAGCQPRPQNTRARILRSSPCALVALALPVGSRLTAESCCVRRVCYARRRRIGRASAPAPSSRRRCALRARSSESARDFSPFLVSSQLVRASRDW